jgi:2,6-dihydroxypyridine 3-monooxygenase
VNVAVIGGSLGGLTAALLLRDMGADVHVYERSPNELVQRGAGIGFLPESQRYLTTRAGVALDDISIATGHIRYLDRAGHVVHDERHDYRFSSWNTVYRQLLACVKPDMYHLGYEMVDWHGGGENVQVDFRNGTRITADLVVFADGVNSLARQRLLPDAHPNYAGYVAWRGMVHESGLSRDTLEMLDDAITYHVYANSHILVYPIPGLDGEVEHGKRLFNFVWYRNYMAGGDLDDLMTDNDGKLRDISLPPGSVSSHHVDEMRAVAASRLPRQIADVVCGAEQPFVQVVYDLAISKMVFGRTCLLGDAAFIARPHAAAGTAKAADDAWSLVESLESHSDVREALAVYEERQLVIGRDLMERTQRIGRRSQFDDTWIPGDPELIFGLKAPGV